MNLAELFLAVIIGYVVYLHGYFNGNKDGRRGIDKHYNIWSEGSSPKTSAREEEREATTD